MGTNEKSERKLLADKIRELCVGANEQISKANINKMLNIIGVAMLDQIKNGHSCTIPYIGSISIDDIVSKTVREKKTRKVVRKKFRVKPYVKFCPADSMKLLRELIVENHSIKTTRFEEIDGNIKITKSDKTKTLTNF